MPVEDFAIVPERRRKFCPLCLVASAIAAFYETISIKHSVYRTHRGQFDHRELADELVSDLGRFRTHGTAEPSFRPRAAGQ
jgi:hypothetical protein